MLYALERGLDKFGIDFYLVGAVARNVWMTGINNIAPRQLFDFGSTSTKRKRSNTINLTFAQIKKMAHHAACGIW
jgi:hypothetical protein